VTPITFTTKRLVASRLCVAHLETLCAMHGDPAVMATLGGIRSPARTRAFLGRNLRHWERYGFGLWIFRHKTDGRFVGRGGLRHVTLHGRPDVEISYALMPTFWGKGLANEIATASVELSRCLGMRSLVAFTLPGNRGSRRVMEKVGFGYERDILYTGIPHVLYRRNTQHSESGGLGGRSEPPNSR
jgi:RimJ/RimL family protein N-acetyltransferase